MSRRHLIGLAFAGLMGVMLTTGCGYDARRILDIGITTSSHPYFAVYPGDYFNSTPIGYSCVHGNYYGLSRGQFGWMSFDDESWGALLWGSEQLQIGVLNVNDRQQFAPSRLAALKAKGEPLPTTSPRYNVGLARMIFEDDAPPPLSFIACRRNFHFGWIGIHAALHPANLLDFLIGWTGYDLMNDDNLPPPLTQEQAAAPAASAAPTAAPAAPAEPPVK